MKASAIEFRLRVVIIAGIVTLGYWAPWIEAWGIGRRNSLLEGLALELSRLGLLPFMAAVPVVIVLAALIAAKAVFLRVWGTAYLGTFKVNHGQMKAGAVLADGPYRYMRNPLYLGTWCMVAAMAFLMPVSGALFALVLITVFQTRLILAEEAFLSVQLGECYRAYLRDVPRLFPHLHTRLLSTGRKPHWLRAVLAEICPIGVFLTLACLSWSYNNGLMVRAIVVSFGVSLVVRAFLTENMQQTTLPE
ncbi:MAG: isoprenylcysteine carboxylmethyltransferase family protein [Terracidiphilus sp.]|nr:isoprenylcysteine carboxylmethyltransferase family protein [Terracidiphilus sp.]MDR3775434.1 isoprenylcysteine carboxylmethyltransferase family protein [Terracidiphilus sp.]